MPKTTRQTATISIRVPAQVKIWVEQHGGGDFVKALLITQWYESQKKSFDSSSLTTIRVSDLEV